jgi:hypothetical protein
VGTKDRTAAVTDDFDSAAPPRVRAEQKVKRDGYGRYLIPHPVTGKKQAWQRATTFVKMLEDNFGLMTWQQRMIAKGLSMRPDLIDVISTLDVKRDREQLNKLLEEAKNVAGAKVAANVGTTVHKHTEEVDLGEPLDSVPPRYRPDVAAYRRALWDAGIKIVPSLVERITVVPELDVGGTLDRIVLDRDGRYRVLDVKSGNMDFGQLAICMQLALYAHGVNTAGVYNLDTGIWLPGPCVETDYGLVAHIVPGSGTCELLHVPIDAGWEAVRVAADVREKRKLKKLFTPYDPDVWTGQPAVGGYVEPAPAPAPVPPSLEQLFSSVASREQAAALYPEALKILGQGPELNRMVALARERLASLASRSG